MRHTVKQAFKNLTGSLSANLVAAVVSLLMILIVPKFFGVEDFAYWQLYILYVSFVGFLHFGWVDGIYLRYGGEYYDQLDKKLLSSQFWALTALQTVALLGITTYTVLFIDDPNKLLILALTGVSCLLLNVRAFFQSLLLASNRIMTYSTNLILEKVIFVAGVAAVIVFGLLQYEYLLAADIIAKTVTLLALCYLCRDIISAGVSKFSTTMREAYTNVSVGIKLMLANIAGILIIGIVRFAIEHIWGIEQFGRISLSVTIASVLMVFIGSVSVVLFPLLKRADEKTLPKVYSMLRTAIMLTALGALIFYYPIQYLLGLWLPDYASGLVYLALLFPLCVYEAKMSMLITTYLKALRRERDILWVNLVSVALSFAGVFLFAVVLNNLTLTVLLITVVLGIRAGIAEIALAKNLPIKYRKDIIIEAALTILFVVTAWFIGGLLGLLIYVIAYLGYVLRKRNEIRKVVNLLRAR